MRNISNKQIKNDPRGFKKISPANLPPLQRCYYFILLIYFIQHYSEIIDSIFSSAKGKLMFPFGYKYLGGYLTGYKFKYKSFSENDLGIKGVNGFHSLDGSTVCIFYNKKLSPERKRFTIVHELFHFYQSRDPFIIKIFNGLTKHDDQNNDIVGTLLEEIADMAAFIYLIPSEYADKKFKNTKNTFKAMAEYAISNLKESIKSI